MAITEIQGIIKDPSKLKDIFGSTPILIDDIPVDVLLNETPIYSSDITKHKVEAGLDVTDNRNRRPVGLILECIFTDPDFSLGNVVGSLLSGENPLAQQTWQEKKGALEALDLANKAIDVVTPLDTYESMMITSIQPTVDVSKSRAFFFKIEFEEIRVVSSDVVAVDDSLVPQKLKEKADPAAKKKTGKLKNAGKKAAGAASPKSESVLSKLLSKLGI